jgi:pimeloyl-ACP methyl ester carboxylesterase
MILIPVLAVALTVIVSAPLVCAPGAVHAAPEDALPRKGHAGIRVAPVPEDVRKAAGLAKGGGVLIAAVIPGSPAEAAGIRSDDILLTLDGRGVRDVDDVLNLMAAMKVGTTFEITLLRGGQRLGLDLVLQERPRDAGDGYDVLYHHVVSRGARIRTIVTRPHGAGPHPALFFIPGLGPMRIDEPLSASHPYFRILQEFARHGYVTVRVEKPGIGDSEGGPYVDMDFESELDVYRQALLATKQYDFVSADAVFVLGHSIGGVFAPVLISEIPVKGVAVYGTLAKTWTEYLLENTRRQATLAGGDPATIDAELRLLAIASQELVMDGKRPEDVVRARPELRGVLDKLLVPGGRLYGRAVRFWSQVARMNLPEYWAKTDAHVLAVWGRNDFISGEADHKLIAETVNRQHPGKAAYLVLEESDHAFRKTSSAEDSFRRWRLPNQEFNARIITTLEGWTEKVRLGHRGGPR